MMINFYSKSLNSECGCEYEANDLKGGIPSQLSVEPDSR